MSQFLGMRQFGSLLDERTEVRKSNKDNLVPFGVSYLDDALEGILPNDLILITAPSGVGKTELVAQIALNAAKKNKKLYFLPLETYKGEVEERLFYKGCVQKFYLDPHRSAGVPDYLKWAHGKQEDLLQKYYEETKTELSVFRDNITLLDGGDDFGIEDFEKIFTQAAVADRADLVILDHLHYMEAQDENENKFHKQALKKMQEMVKRHGVPMLLVAHIRKRDRKQKIVAPGMEDIHGSSDIFKMATKMISIAKAPADKDSKTLFPTYFRTAKVRYGGGRDQFIGVCAYDVTRNDYLPDYNVGRLSSAEDDVELLEGPDRPHWFRDSKLRLLQGAK